jgi:hypothetical protein
MSKKGKMNDQILIAVILVAVTIAFSDLSLINPTKDTCNDDYCEIDYYEKFKSDPRFKV